MSMVQLTDNIWAVEVPDWANGFKIESIPQVDLYELTCYEIGEYNEPKREDGIDLSPGTWKFLFTTKKSTEEDARKIVRELPVGKRFENYNGDYPVWCHTARESLQSLLKAKGCDVSKNYAIIQKL